MQTTMMDAARPVIETILTGLEGAALDLAQSQLAKFEERAVTMPVTTGEEAIAQILQITRWAGTLEASRIDGPTAKRAAVELHQIAQSLAAFIGSKTGATLDPAITAFYAGPTAGQA